MVAKEGLPKQTRGHRYDGSRQAGAQLLVAGVGVPADRTSRATGCRKQTDRQAEKKTDRAENRNREISVFYTCSGVGASWHARYTGQAGD